MNSLKYNFYYNMYRMKRISTADVWAAADKNEITTDEAVRICGPRPQ